MRFPDRQISVPPTVYANDDGIEVKEISTLRRAMPQFIAVGVKNLVLFGYGMTLGFPTIVIPAIKGGDGRSVDQEFSLTDDQISWFSSINLLCVPLGCFLSGALTEPVGKRRAMQLVNIPMFISWLLFYFATNINHLYAGLCLSGLSGGLMEAPVLTYVAEVTQPQFRGMLAATGTTCVITGIFVQFVLGAFFTWRTVAMLCVLLPLATILALCFIPESPYWLLTKGRVDESRSALAWLRGWVPFGNVKSEFDDIHRVLMNKKKEADALASMSFMHRMLPYTRQSFIAPFALVSATFFIGHFSGKTPLQTYAVQIFHTLKAPIDKYYATIFLGAAELAGALTCVFLVHVTGKRPLVFASLIGCGLCFFGTATYANYLNLVPGGAVNNVVANVSSLENSMLIDVQNLTDDSFYLAEQTTVYIDEYIATETSASDSGEDATTETDDTDYYETGELDLLKRYDHDDDTNVRYNIYNVTDDIESTTREKRTHRLEHANVDGNSSSEKVPNEIVHKIILPIPHADQNQLLWLPLTMLIGSAYFAHMGIRLIPWMLIGEVFPVSVRSGASGYSSGIGYIFGFFSNKLFLGMVATLTLPGTFWFYSGIAAIGCIILYFTLPETEGKTLIEIESYFVSSPASSVENRSSGAEPNRQSANGFDQVTVLPPSYPFTNGTCQQTLRIGDENDFGNEKNEERRSSLALDAISAVPEIIVSTPRAGSKRFMKTTNEVRRMSSVTVNSGEDSTDL